MIKAIIFDLGAVLIDWDPQYLYKKLFSEEPPMTDFLANICTPVWNEEQDGGRSLSDATDLLIKEHPHYEENIRAFYSRWDEMLGGAIDGTVEILKQLKDSEKYKIYALTNWSAETFPIAQKLAEYEFLNWFDGIVVSGTEKMRKPAQAFYQILLNRYHVAAEECLFIDDNLRNVTAAREMGIESIHFTSPEELKSELQKQQII